MTKPSLSYRVTATALALLFAYAAVIAQDITGGAGVLLASADVEAKLGKGIFTPAQSKPHVNKAPDKKTVARSVRSAHPRTNTAANNRPSNTNSGNSGGNTNSNRTGGARPAMDAESYNKRGDDLFDAGKYNEAAAAYQQAIKLRADYADAYLNLGETYFNLGRYDEAIAVDNKAISLKSDWAEAYRALGIAYLTTKDSAKAITALKRANELNSADAETRNSLGLAFYDQGAAAYNANNYEEAIGRYHEAISYKA